MSTEESFTTSFVVDRTPQQVYDAINHVRSWWIGDIEGDTQSVGDVFVYANRDVHRSTQTVTESVPGERIVWEISDGFLNFATPSDEWNGTRVIFTITERNGQSELQFRHLGLSPQCDCYGACSGGWTTFIDDCLRAFILTGEPQPDPYATTA